MRFVSIRTSRITDATSLELERHGVPLHYSVLASIVQAHYPGLHATTGQVLAALVKTPIAERSAPGVYSPRRQLHAHDQDARIESLRQYEPYGGRPIAITQNAYLDLKRRIGILREELRDISLSLLLPQQANIISQLTKLEETFRRAVVRSETARAQLGSLVTLELVPSGKLLVYFLVEPGLGNMANDELSIDSPVGQALVGAQVGETIEVSVGSRIINYNLISVDH